MPVPIFASLSTCCVFIGCSIFFDILWYFNTRTQDVGACDLVVFYMQQKALTWICNLLISLRYFSFIKKEKYWGRFVSIHRVDRSDGSKYVVYDEYGKILIISKNKLVCVAEVKKRLAAWSIFRRNIYCVAVVNHDFWFAPMATVRTAWLCFDLLNVDDATINELLHWYVLVVATFAALNV